MLHVNNLITFNKHYSVMKPHNIKCSMKDYLRLLGDKVAVTCLITIISNLVTNLLCQSFATAIRKGALHGVVLLLTTKQQWCILQILATYSIIIIQADWLIRYSALLAARNNQKRRTWRNSNKGKHKRKVLDGNNFLPSFLLLSYSWSSYHPMRNIKKVRMVPSISWIHYSSYMYQAVTTASKDWSFDLMRRENYFSNIMQEWCIWRTLN